MICYVLAMGKQHLGSHVVVGYGIKIFWPGLFITSPDHLAIKTVNVSSSPLKSGNGKLCVNLINRTEQFSQIVLRVF